MKTIILASRNKDKIEELRTTLQNLNIELKSALDFAMNEVEEDRNTLKDNAFKKARYVHRQTNLPTLADDTGLEVQALDGRPGVFSARYAGEHAAYQENVDKLLEELSGVASKDRGAQFRTVVAFVTDEETHSFEGICRGSILLKPKGSAGFGYDPVFQPKGYNQTFAQLSTDEKNTISHRGKAIEKFYQWLKKSNE